jgi:DNA-binding MarR family transcriptional regulator
VSIRVGHEATRTSSGTAFTALVLEVLQTNGAIVIEGDRLVSPFGLTSARWLILGHVEAHPMTVASIARQLGLQRQSVKRVVDAMIDEGIVEQRGNPNHLRAKLIALTASGRRLFNKALKVQIEWSNALGSILTLAEYKTTIASLKKLRAAAQESTMANRKRAGRSVREKDALSA